jgi:hypothetical protein
MLLFHVMYDFFLQSSEKAAMGMGFFVFDPSDSLSSIKGPNKQGSKTPTSSMLINEFFFFFFKMIVTQDWVQNDSLNFITQDWASPSQIWARRCPDLCILRSWPWQDPPPPIRGLTADVKRRISAGKKFFWWSGF